MEHGSWQAGSSSGRQSNGERQRRCGQRQRGEAAHGGTVPPSGESHLRPEQNPNDRHSRFNGAVATGFVGIYSFELFFPESHSLKEKRMHLRSVKAQLTNRVSCSIAEVDHHDVWQRSRLTIACVAREASEADRLLDTAERWLAGQEFELLVHERDLVTLDD
jgi:uncharacterized protein YlxP (DUF503 family)